MKKKRLLETPLGRILAEQRELRRLSQFTEVQMYEDWQYIRTHARPLFWAEIAALFDTEKFPGSTKRENPGIWTDLWFQIAWKWGKMIFFNWLRKKGTAVFKNMFHF